MTHWILILTLYSGVSYGGGPAITSVSGFESRDACLAAGNAWLSQVNRKAKANEVSYFWTTATCVANPTTPQARTP